MQKLCISLFLTGLLGCGSVPEKTGTPPTQAKSKVDSYCLHWFQSTGFSEADNQCFLKCTSYKFDEGNFICSSACEDLCKPKCTPLRTWGHLLKVGRPPGEGSPLERPVPWSREEKAAVLSAMARLPHQLRSIGPIEIYRIGVSGNFLTPQNPGAYEKGGIILYNAAFGKPYSLTRVLAHEFAHALYDSLPEDERASYREATAWIYHEGNGQESDFFESARSESGFVEEDGRESPTEDFAKNIEYFLFNPQKLARVTPSAYRWIQNHFRSNFRLDGDCLK